MNAHFRNFAFNWLPVTETATLNLSKASGYSNLSLLVLEIVKPGYEFLCLANGEHERLYSIGYAQSTSIFSAA